jgi:hypothetical protein
MRGDRRIRKELLPTAAAILAVCGVGPALRAQDREPVEALQLDLRSALERALGEAFAEPDRPLSADEARAAAAAAFAAWRTVVGPAFVGEVPPLPPRVEELRALGAEEFRAGIRRAYPIRVGEHEMPYRLLRREPEAGPTERAGGRPLYLCLHGGGQQATAEGPHAWDVNSREWDAQTALAAAVYPAEGLFLIPRMADDRLGRWWHRHQQIAFDRLIQVAIAHWGVDPDQVHLLGISEGGYGTDILAPFMPDRFAAANAMAAGVDPAGHPPENLRNLPFRTDIGAGDTMYDRIGLARKFHARLDALRGPAGGDGYLHVLAEQADRGHGIDYRPGLAWLGGRRREPWPRTVTWVSRVLDGRRRPACSWVGLDTGDAGEVRIEARLDVDGNGVDLAVEPATGLRLRLMLRDEMLDLDEEVTVRINGSERFSGRVARTARHLVETLAERGDPQLCFPVVVELSTGG